MGSEEGSKYPPASLILAVFLVIVASIFLLPKSEWFTQTGGAVEKKIVGEVSYAYALFDSAGSRGAQITVPVGSSVAVTIGLILSGGLLPTTEGTLIVEVRKDMVALPDSTVTRLVKVVTLSKGENDVAAGYFTAAELTPGSLFKARSYFVKVYWADNVIYDPTDPNAREWVKTR